MSVVANLAIFPLGRSERLGEFVARVLRVINKSGLDHRLGPMGTALEGDFDRVMQVAGQCMKELEKDNERVYMTLTIDNRKGIENRLEGKVESVERAMNSIGGLKTK